MKFALLPSLNVEETCTGAFGWVSTSNDPQFLVKNAKKLGGMEVRISFNIKADNVIISGPKLYWDSGTGLNENNSFDLTLSDDGNIDECVALPYPLLLLRLDPFAQTGAFDIDSFAIEIVRKRISFTERCKYFLLYIFGFLARLYDRKFLSSRAYLVSNDNRDYQSWTLKYDLSLYQNEIYKKKSKSLDRKPLISILMPTYNSNEKWLKEALQSVIDQVYDNWELCVADDNSSDPETKKILREYSKKDSRIKIVFRSANGHISAATNSALEVASGDFAGLMDHDDKLHPMALYFVAQAINKCPDAKLIYTDEDFISEDGMRNNPYFKCEFNYDLFLSHNMITHFGVYEIQMLRELGGLRSDFDGAQDYDLALRFIEQISGSQILHIPRVLYHWRVHPDSTANSGNAKPYAHLAAMRAIEDHLKRKGVEGRVEPASEAAGCNVVRYKLPKKLPLVEIIVPTRDGLSVLKQCIDSIMNRTDYGNYILTIVDNGSSEKRTIDYLKKLQQVSNIKVVRDDTPFNYPKLNNKVALNSAADYVLLLNNDVEVINQGWLSEMVSIAIQPGVGCVGARLWYPNNTLQHGGLIYGIGGLAGHSHKHIKRGSPGYAGRAVLRQTLSGVTGACLLVSRNIYMEAGGLSEQYEIALNDVDFCLKVNDLGFRNVWTPFAELYHHESATRGYENTPEKKARFQRESDLLSQAWGDKLLNDPYYSPNLTLDSEDFNLAWPPRVSNEL